jgi:FkbM family methyltransferase
MCSSIRTGCPPLGRVLQRDYVAAWRQFSWIPPRNVAVLVDVGAHDGLFAQRAALYFDLSRVILVEPLPDNAAVLRGLQLPGVKVIEAALSNMNSRAAFVVSKTAQASSLLPLNPAMSEAYSLDMSDERKIDVQVTTLDDLCMSENITHIDLLKIDVQGAEKLLLQGATTSLTFTRYIQVEALFVEHYHGCALFCELDELLRDAGFSLCRLSDFLQDSKGRLLQADAVYCKV